MYLAFAYMYFHILCCTYGTQSNIYMLCALIFCKPWTIRKCRLYIWKAIGPTVLVLVLLSEVIYPLQGQVSIRRCQNFLWKEDLNENNVQVADSGSEYSAKKLLISKLFRRWTAYSSSYSWLFKNKRINCTFFAIVLFKPLLL